MGDRYLYKYVQKNNYCKKPSLYWKAQKLILGSSLNPDQLGCLLSVKVAICIQYTKLVRKERRKLYQIISLKGFSYGTYRECHYLAENGVNELLTIFFFISICTTFRQCYNKLQIQFPIAIGKFYKQQPFQATVRLLKLISFDYAFFINK